MTSRQTIEALRDPAFLQQVRASLAAWSGDADPTLVEATVTWIETVRGELAELLQLVEEPEDVAMVCAITLLELKAHWIIINTRLNYAATRDEAVDPAQAFRGTALSSLVDTLEQFLPARHVEAFHALLAAPLAGSVTRILDEVGNDAVAPRPGFAPVDPATGATSTGSPNTQRRLAV